jgi:hypothetical protein
LASLIDPIYCFRRDGAEALAELAGEAVGEEMFRTDARFETAEAFFETMEACFETL